MAEVNLFTVFHPNRVPVKIVQTVILLGLPEGDYKLKSVLQDMSPALLKDKQ